MKSNKHLTIIALSLLLMLSCGGEKKEKEGFSYERTSTSSDSKKSDNDIANIVITGDDFMKYNKTEIKAKAGQKVKLTLRHIGKLDKNIMGHNVVILKSGTDVLDFATKAATQRDNDYIPKGTDAVIAHTKMIGAGETTVVEFTAPEAGTYDFLCSFPAHYAMMKGKFIVE